MEINSDAVSVACATGNPFVELIPVVLRPGSAGASGSTHEGIVVRRENSFQEKFQAPPPSIYTERQPDQPARLATPFR